MCLRFPLTSERLFFCELILFFFLSKCIRHRKRERQKHCGTPARIFRSHTNAMDMPPGKRTHRFLGEDDILHQYQVRHRRYGEMLIIHLHGTLAFCHMLYDLPTNIGESLLLYSPVSAQQIAVPLLLYTQCEEWAF